jgi:flagellar protein FliL
MSDAAPAAEAAPAAPPSKKSPKLLIILLSVVIAAAAAGGGVYFAVAGGSQDEDATEESAGKADKSAQKGAKKDAVKAPAIYVKFDPPFVVNFEAKGLMRFLQVSIELMTRDLKTADLIRQHDPLLRNELLMLLGSQTYEKISTREGKEQLRIEALQAVAAVIQSEGGDPKKVEQLYFTSFVMQ